MSSETSQNKISVAANLTAAKLAAVRTRFARRERARRLASAMLLLIGLPACLFGPFILTCIYWLLGLIWIDKIGIYLPWTWIFAIATLLIVPLTFWTEKRTRGDFLSEAVGDGAPAAGRLMIGLGDIGMLVAFARHPRVSSAGLVELMLWGPRQVLDAIDRLRRIRQVHGADRNLAAEILLRLCAIDHATTAEFGAEEKSGRDVLMSLAYLLAFDWIGISADGKRVWILSDVRESLQNALRSL